MSLHVRRHAAPVGLALAVAALTWSTLGAQGRTDSDIVWKIRQEATANSQILPTLHMLTDVYGPRLTGSPNLRGAQDWVVKQATAWGLSNAHLEAWDFGHPGWLNERVSAFVTAPVKDTLVVEVLAWTPGTDGTVSGQTVLIEPPARPTEAELTAFFDKERARVKGRTVMVGPPQWNEVTIFPGAKRRNESDLSAFKSDEPAPSPFGNAGPPAARPGALPAAQVAERLDQFLVEAGALVRLNDAGREHGQIRAFNNRTFDVAKAIPTLVVRNEDYGRLARIMADGTAVTLEVTIVNHVYPEGATQHNVVAEIPGTDKAQEVVMLGGHLDSWHAATGATDNAIGCAVMLEAIRILKAVGVQPRRTIRVALWSGEEQGLLGSQAYVKQHFGSFENPTPEYQNFAGYFNIDSGTGRARGMTVFGPPSAAAMLRPALAPFADNGLVGSSSTESRRLGGSDHTSFNQAGLPGIGVSQDPIEYGTHTWHTNLDTYERIIESDAQASAMAIAAAVYHLAMADQQLPRFDKANMPKPPSSGQ
ncbi:MAG: M20/M25/M40 family metallo-hydrolase [Vicinamibacterales bacterium]